MVSRTLRVLIYTIPLPIIARNVWRRVKYVIQISQKVHFFPPMVRRLKLVKIQINWTFTKIRKERDYFHSYCITQTLSLISVLQCLVFWHQKVWIEFELLMGIWKPKGKLVITTPVSIVVFHMWSLPWWWSIYILIEFKYISCWSSVLNVVSGKSYIRFGMSRE